MISALFTGVLHVLITAIVIGPLAWGDARRKNRAILSPGAGRMLLVAAGIYIGSFAVVELPRVGLFADLAWNWQNKLLLAALLALVVTLWSGLSWRQIGLRRPKAGWWRTVLAILAGVVAFQIAAGPMGSPDLSIETVAFQAVVPGIDEELLFRGVLLAIVGAAFTARWQLHDARFGWAVPVTALLFGLMHGVRFSEDLSLEVDLASVIATGIVGLILAWVRVKTDSLWPVVLLHNAINLSVVAFVAFTT